MGRARQHTEGLKVVVAKMHIDCSSNHSSKVLAQNLGISQRLRISLQALLDREAHLEGRLRFTTLDGFLVALAHPALNVIHEGLRLRI